MRLFLTALASIAVLGACQPRPPVDAGVEAGDAGQSGLPVAGESRALAFDVSVTVSPAAGAELARLNERLVISAQYYGEPKPDSDFAVEPGDAGIPLNTEEAEIAPAAQTVRFDGAYDAVTAAQYVAGDARVLINAYSARLSGPDNLVSCDTVDAPLTAIHADGAAIACRLISE
jgi:hypothetical protein